MQLAPLFPIIYQILKPIFPDCLWSGESRYVCVETEAIATRRIIALTFDDGPHPQYTPQLLKVLDYYNIQASFFLLGACVHRSPHITKELRDRGHWIGLHGYDHKNFPMLSELELQQSLEKTQVAICNACDLQPEQLRDVRPPNGLFTPTTLKLLRQWNYRPVMWSVVPEDWALPGVQTVVQRVLQQVKAGSLIVLHDGNCGGQDVTAIAQILIPKLLEQGYQFVSVDTLWQQVL
ncbi:polysaccharide deacetylase family protein [Aetokthonos hydrillicola Thurmond2011]|jgi:peptidoglycan/xylan/chitin deacetylase (PgdA/CDA1 family)|uniref:Polysaccharide deacetylase family protein n=1 Tax=Aetokthonos hydrillicola Thurmond2011 TaxID=2712845 RepID=A0AAP5IB20_9CYAN|nr:polysaccharide deacetylase family protein [Aetokthonos hydrillicola]MBO3463444.1 polysaccharide deacetylase family protein [Aetokthonos hydrillicola CCALA 1050]MBW4588947.1 polysaccharide deacetylase family protein [Aetokthonos hydrillicola CCALA 1050]MDR9898226.1 polysaccharide deacetylase family protein [Aetokthonos hydrillicola Thurmond2011]